MNIKDFWTNGVWYIALGVLSALLLSYTLFKSKMRKRHVGFFFAIFGLTLFIETVIYIFLRAYEYYPHIIPNSPKDDGVLGNIFSQISISTAALFVCTFDISLGGIVLISTAFFLIEELFLTLGIYQHYWYKSWITFAGIIILFQFIKKWHKLSLKKPSRKLQYITIMLGAIALYLPTTNWLGILCGLYDIKEDILIDPFISHAVVAIPKYLILINIAYYLVKRKTNWIWSAVMAVVVLLIDTILYYTNLLHVREGWLLIYSGISASTAYLYVYIMDKLLKQGQE